MKKLLSVLMALLLCGMALAEDANPDVAGDWTLTAVQVGDVVYGEEDLAERGAHMDMRLNEDGSAWGDNGFEKADGSWEIAGERIIVTLDDAPMPFRLVDGQLHSDDGSGAVMIFSRVAAEDLAAVAGDWVLTAVQEDDVVYGEADLAERGVRMDIRLYADGSAWGDNGFKQADGSWEVAGERIIVTLDDAPMPFRLVDGQLHSDDGSGAVMIFSRVEAES